MRFEREHYINKLISSKHNHLIKIVTGLRRVGKSYLLFNLYKQHLLTNGVDVNHIIELQLDSFAHRKYRKAETLYEYVENLTNQDSQMYYVMIDEVQMNAKDNKDLVLRVTDPELLRKTGGIVQGMSGSPILQNGKLIGAVTHVFVNNPRKGYGIFIEDMLTK